MISSRRFAQAACLIALSGSFATGDVSSFQGDTATAKDEVLRVQHAHSEASTIKLRAGPQAGPDSHALPLAVDGARNPELVPDALAYRHFFLSTIPLDGVPAAESSRRQQLRLTRLGLEAHDREAYVHAMGLAGESLALIAVQRASWLSPPLNTATGREMLKRLAEQEVQVFEDTRQRLRHSLTTEGFGRLDAHVRDHVKRQIKIYGSAAK